ncbi:hypothetical protein DPMN_085312 [Dreissena polymorpha]|uniref:Ig-like domain-containing protein n=1 Tax=Dreissena polymorpha TaxID=45954 RepID=A0A9D3YG76_DREPO|nr:hypothetical protein DPMN_085312 [Dreissena polymorpha]
MTHHMQNGSYAICSQSSSSPACTYAQSGQELPILLMRHLATMQDFLFYDSILPVPELIITRPPRNDTVLENTSFLMHCEAAGRPNLRIKWFHNEKEMASTGVNYRIRPTGALRFREVKVSDRGTYRCKVEAGRESLYSDYAVLVVQGTHILSIIIYTLTLIEGQFVNEIDLNE